MWLLGAQWRLGARWASGLQAAALGFGRWATRAAAARGGRDWVRRLGLGGAVAGLWVGRAWQRGLGEKACWAGQGKGGG
jgi:hypothetical protein